MRRRSGSTLSSTGTLCVSPLLSPSSSRRATPSGPVAPLSAGANYTCANQSTSNEAGLVALSTREGSTTLVLTRRSLGGAWTFLRAHHAFALLNYAEALTSFRPTLESQPFAWLERETQPLIGLPRFQRAYFRPSNSSPTRMIRVFR